MQPRAALYCVRAGLREGQDILELGCGWGSLSLFVARAFPGSRVTAVSNSRTQREYILQRAQELDVRNLQVITADMVEFQVGSGGPWCGAPSPLLGSGGAGRVVQGFGQGVWAKAGTAGARGSWAGCVCTGMLRHRFDDGSELCRP
jgi:hypothetical protein